MLTEAGNVRLAREATAAQSRWFGAPAPHREGFVFEMRNMVKNDAHTLGRFPRDRWLKLAEQQAVVFASLNARLEAVAIADQRTS